MPVLREWLEGGWQRIASALVLSWMVLSLAATLGLRPLIGVISALASDQKSALVRNPLWITVAALVLCSLVMVTTWQSGRQAITDARSESRNRIGSIILLIVSVVLFIQAISFAAISLVMHFLPLH